MDTNTVALIDYYKIECFIRVINNAYCHAVLNNCVTALLEYIDIFDELKIWGFAVFSW